MVLFFSVLFGAFCVLQAPEFDSTQRIVFFAGMSICLFVFFALAYALMDVLYTVFDEDSHSS